MRRDNTFYANRIHSYENIYMLFKSSAIELFLVNIVFLHTSIGKYAKFLGF